MLTPRLKAIYNHVSAETIADIGTDHAYIPIELAITGRIRHSIATDINSGPLSIAAANIKKYGLTNKIELRLGPGLAPILAGEADEMIIAGMGGEMIRQILEEGRTVAQSASRLILQPMNAQYELRKWLASNHFRIDREDIATEGHKVYNILIITNGEMLFSEKDIYLHLPQSLQNHPDFGALWSKKHREFKKIRDGLLRSQIKNESLILKYTELLSDLERIKP